MSGMRVALALLVALASMGGAGSQQLSVWGTLGLTDDREKLIKGLISTMPDWNQYSEEERWKVTGVLLKVFKNWETLGFGESANNADADQKLLEAAFGIGATYAVKPRAVPYIGGIWELTYTYNELKGPADNLIQNPCRGPFPYRYTWDIHVYQEVNDGPNGTRVSTGNIRVCWPQMMDCSTGSRSWRLVEGAEQIVRARCAFKPYDEHPNDWQRYPGYMVGGYQEKIVPTDKDLKPAPEELWSKFHVPRENNVTLPVWGSFCEQFSWYDKEEEVKKAPPYEGAWRHDNETWVILRDISTCPCFPTCAPCEEILPGTMLRQVVDDGGACFHMMGFPGMTPEECEFRIKGVGGGPLRFPTVTTGLEPDDFGNDQVCFSYANLKGFKKKEADQLNVYEAWGKIGNPAENLPPTSAAPRRAARALVPLLAALLVARAAARG